MDWFSLVSDCLCLAGQSVIHLYFAGRLAGKRHRPWQAVLYFMALCGIEYASSRLMPGGGALPIGAGVLALYLMCRFALGSPRPVSWLGAVLAFYISQLSFGMINSVEAVFFPRFIGTPALYPLLAAALGVFFALSAGCCRAVLRLLDCGTERVGLLLFPVIFFFGAQLYILQTSYSGCSPSPYFAQELGKHGALLFLQAAGLGAMLCTVYAYRHLCRGFRARAQVQSLTQAARSQQVYISEAKLRYEQTRAFRHDIRNHLSVLDGLLNEGRTQECRDYLKKLEAVSEALSFPYSTGNPVVDIMLGEKLGLAKDIDAQVSLALPEGWGIDDFDLCVIFANALDNAISACRACEGERFVRVAGKRQGDLYMLTFENTCPDTPLPRAGTGLSNISSAAEKYHGAVLTERDGKRFSLNVLLDISLHPGSISEQKP